MDKSKFLEDSLTRQLYWIQAADSRAGLILSLSTAMLGVLAMLAPESGCWTVWLAILVFLAALLLLASLVFCAIGSFPRTNGPKGSLIYFGGIEKLNVAMYTKKLGEYDEHRYLDDLISQCHINAQVANIKFSWVKRALACLFIGALPWVLSIYYLYK